MGRIPNIPGAWSSGYSLELPRSVVEQAIEALTDQERADMARLSLAGYKFHRGVFYWRVISPDNTTIDTLQPYLRVAIGKAAHDNEERVNAIYQGKREARR